MIRGTNNRSKCVGWLFTINHPGSNDKPAEFPELKRAVWQLERGTEGTTHYQGYMELNKRMRSTELHKISWLSRSALFVRRGTVKQCYDYCTKTETRVEGPWMIGDWSTVKQTKNSVLQLACTDILAGKSINHVAREYPGAYARYCRGLRDLATIIKGSSIPPWRKVEVLVLQGDTQLGKSRYALDLAMAYTGDFDEVYILDASNNSNVWFDGYYGQKVLIIDDFGGFIKYRHLLRILDGYKVRLEVKGGFTWAAWTKVIITTNLMPDEWYKRAGENHDLAPLYRRLPVTVEVDMVLYEDIPCRNTLVRKYTHRGRALSYLEDIKARWTLEAKPAVSEDTATEEEPDEDPKPGPCLPRCDATLTAGQGDPMDSQVTNESQSSFVFIDDE